MSSSNIGKTFRERTVILLELFKIIRENCNPRTWSEAVTLVRMNKIFLNQKDVNSISFFATDPSTAVTYNVGLHLSDGDWTCDCHLEQDPCCHVAGAVIALKQDEDGEQPLASASESKKSVVYRLKRERGSLSFHRALLSEQTETPLLGSLSALTNGAERNSITATKKDLGVEIALTHTRNGALTRPVFAKVLSEMDGLETITLDSIPVKASKRPRGFQIVVIDEASGIKIYGEQDPAITEVFSNGIVLCKDILHPLHFPALDSLETTIVREGKFYSKQEFNSLVSVVIPKLKEKVPVDIRSINLPDQSFERPRLEVRLFKDGEKLNVEPRIAYGDPVIARVVEGQLVCLGGATPTRDMDEEWSLKDQLWQDLAIDLDQKVTLQGEAAVNFVHRLGTFRGDISGDGYDAFRAWPELIPEFKIKAQDFKMVFASGKDGETKEADPHRVMKAWTQGDALVPLLDGGFAPIPKEWMKQYGNKIRDLLATKENRDHTPKSALLMLANMADEMGAKVPKSLKEFAENIKNPKEIEAVNPHIEEILRDYQAVGARWLASLKSMDLGAVLADDMGLGKTIQAISIMKDKVIVICPTSVMFNWANEIKKFNNELTINLYHGPKRKLDKSSVTITSYGVLRLDQKKLNKKTWDIAVLDEAQNIKNPTSQSARAAFALKSNFRIALSGTPVENRLEDLWSLFEFTNPGYLGPLAHFKNNFVKPIVGGQEEIADELREKTKPFILRRLKSEVAKELPPKTESTLYVELSEEERANYVAIEAATQKDVMEKLDGGGNVFKILEALLRLRQASCHSALLGINSDAESSKLNLLISKLKDASECGHKALVFSQWTSMLDLMEPELVKAGVSFSRLDGATRNRQDIVKNFQETDEASVLIMSLKAGGVGINLTAADQVYIMDPWWNPAAEDQAADRTHRIGQDKPVMVYRLVAKNTIEEKILELQEAKRHLSQSVITTGKGSKVISKNELLSLFS
jgi:superfamily II DNA or RNA helicase